MLVSSNIPSIDTKLERENLNSKTLFDKDCSSGSVKNLSNNTSPC